MDGNLRALILDEVRGLLAGENRELFAMSIPQFVGRLDEGGSIVVERAHRCRSSHYCGHRKHIADSAYGIDGDRAT